MRLPIVWPCGGVGEGFVVEVVELRDEPCHCYSDAPVSSRCVSNVFIDCDVQQSSVCVVRMINSTCELLVDVLINHVSATNVDSSSAFRAGAVDHLIVTFRDLL